MYRNDQNIILLVFDIIRTMEAGINVGEMQPSTKLIYKLQIIAKLVSFFQEIKDSYVLNYINGVNKHQPCVKENF